ncbi:hypothetical protein SUDANB37_05644 [Streptomyces sp. enrichment culture]
MHPVLEAAAPDGFALWPIAHVEPDAFLRLSGELTPYEAGTALLSIAAHNDPAAAPKRPADPLGSSLHGPLTEEWRDWYEVLDGDGSACFGHDPDA